MHAGYRKDSFDEPGAMAAWEKEWKAKQDRPRFYSYVTKSRFLHLEDSLEIGKVRFFAGAYQRGQGSTSIVVHFLDLTDARVLFSDLAWGKPVEFTDYKGSVKADGIPQSRVLKIRLKETTYWVEIHNGPGQIIGHGAIKPAGEPSAQISIPLPIFEARRLAHAALAYIRAWEANNLKALVIPQEMATFTPGAPPAGVTNHTNSPAHNSPPLATQSPPTSPAGVTNPADTSQPVSAESYHSLVAEAISAGVALDTIDQITRIANGPGGWEVASAGIIAAMQIHNQGNGIYNRQTLIHRILELREHPAIKSQPPPLDPLWQWTWPEHELISYGQGLKSLISQSK